MEAQPSERCVLKLLRWTAEVAIDDALNFGLDALTGTALLLLDPLFDLLNGVYMVIERGVPGGVNLGAALLVSRNQQFEDERQLLHQMVAVDRLLPMSRNSHLTRACES